MAPDISTHSSRGKATQSPRLENGQDQLMRLVDALGVSQEEITVRLSRPEYPDLADADQKWASDLLKSKNEEVKRQKSVLRRSFSKSNLNVASVASKTATSILLELFDAGCTPGQVRILLQNGADVNFVRQKSSSVVKRVRGKDQEDVRSDIFLRSVKSNDVILVNVLADKADQTNLDAGLRLALERRQDALRHEDASAQQTSFEMIQILLLAGANPNACSDGILGAISLQDFAVLESMCSVDAAVQLDGQGATLALYDVVRFERSDTLRMLLRCGANCNNDSPSALELAVTNGNIETVALFCLAAASPAPSLLAKCVTLVYRQSTYAHNEVVQMANLLLAAGADGSELSEALLSATTKLKHDLVRLLVQHGTYGDEILARALLVAMKHGHCQIFTEVLSVPTPADLRDRLLLTLHVAGGREQLLPEIRREMTSALVKVGVSQLALSKALYEVTTHCERGLSEYLLESGASVDYKSGQTLVTVIKRRSVSSLKMLLDGRVVSNAALDSAMTSLAEVELPLRLEMAKALLQAGAKGKVINKALLQAVNECDRTRDSYSMIDILLKAGAKVDVSRDGPLIKMIENSDPYGVHLLQPYVDRTSDLQLALDASNRVTNLDHRFMILDMLLTAGAQGSCITGSLIDVLERFPRETRLTRLLVKKGRPDINLSSGKVVVLAVTHQDVELIQMLLLLQPSLETLNGAFQAATRSQDRPERLVICEMLLKAGAKGTTIDEALTRAVLNTPTEIELVKVLLRYGASIDHDSGRALCLALAAHDNALLTLLLQRPAKQSTIMKVLDKALSQPHSDENTLAVEALLNSKTTYDSSQLGGLLEKSLVDGHDNRVFMLLLQKGASVESGSPGVFAKAINLNKVGVLQALLDGDATETTVRQAFELAWKSRAQSGFELISAIASQQKYRVSLPLDQYLVNTVAKQPCSIPTIRLLLGFQASINHSNFQAVQITLRRFDLEVLKVLLEVARPQSYMQEAFKISMCQNENWDAADYSQCSQCVNLVLRFCRKGPDVDEVLLTATKRCYKSNNARGVMDDLIAFGASVDHDHGAALRVAIQIKQPAVMMHAVNRLFDSGPSKKTINDAFPYILKSGHPEKVVSRLIDIFVKRAGASLDLNIQSKTSEPVLFTWVAQEGCSLTVLRKLLLAGAQPDQMKDISLFSSLRPETATLQLHLAFGAYMNSPPLTQRMLIEHGANIEFTTPASSLTPLWAAILRSNHSAVATLVEHGANVCLKRHSETPLFYACRTQDLKTMQILLSKTLPRDDGSLHEAARVGSYEALSLLLDRGWDPNLPSAAHKMKAVLEIVATECDNQDSDQLKQILVLLATRGANTKFQRNGKSLLFIALDSANAKSTLEPLVCALMRNTINDNVHLLRENGVAYSPVAYLMQGKNKKSAEEIVALLDILEAYGCRNVFYHETGPQPKGFTGAPEHIVAAEAAHRERLRREAAEKAAHEEQLRRAAEMAAAQLRAKEAEFKAAQERERQKRLETERHAKAAHEAALQRQRQKDADREAAAKRQNELQLAASRDARRERALDHQQRVAEVQEVLALKDSYEQRSHNRAIEQASAQDRLIDKQKRLMDSAAGYYGAYQQQQQQWNGYGNGALLPSRYTRGYIEDA